MKIFTSLSLAGLLLCCLPAKAQMAYIPGEVLVQFKESSNPTVVVDRYRTLRGIPTLIELGELLSAPMNIYKVHFSPGPISEQALLTALRNDRDITIAQFNHYVNQRSTVPNDPQIGSQWHHINTGQTNGTPNADIDSDLAWDITTGGVTALGDTIVVCVIEGGNLNHPDLAPNAWRNIYEIPGNGIDDDGNGYIDDYLGWNVASQSDQGVLQGGHGTQVMGMIGAKGDNGLGVAGANWDVKIMSVAGENLFNEASVVAAYAYPLVMRKLYDETDGALGAFVVATNASWGIDNGNINDVPIWAAYYDTLGKYGILNCGATANNNVDIDVVGDIPTAAPSDYMISVTATNHNDVRTFSAYGATTVDLGAPGANVFTTSGQQGYTSTSGTSFASPLTAGVIALLYSAPCPALAQLAKDNPQGAADLIRFVLFEGVDPVPNLQGQTVTGGRLNANNSLMLIMQTCGDGVCLPPFSFNQTLQDDVIYTFSWNSLSDEYVSIRYRIQGEEEWVVIDSIAGNTMSIDTLMLCTAYEFQIGSACSATDTTDVLFGATNTFTTKGCCIAPADAEITAVTEETTSISWIFPFNVDEYDLYYREIGAMDWIFVNTYQEGEAFISDLAECTFYELLLNPGCAEDLESGYLTTIRTKGCGACIDNEYCDNFGESTVWEFIQSITINNLLFQTGNNGGYLFTEDSGIELEVLGEYAMTLTPGFVFGTYQESFRVWIDFDQNSVFTNNELVLASASGSNQPLTGTINIPESALLGETRMRVSMKFVGNTGSPAGACEIFAEGETEDYCVTITESTIGTSNVDGNGSFKVYPNPTNGLVRFEKLDESVALSDLLTLSVIDLSGKTVIKTSVNKTVQNVDLSGLEDGMYLYLIHDSRRVTIATGKLVLNK